MVSIKQSERRFRTYSAVFLLIQKDGKLLMQKRAGTGWRDGEYSPVVGHLDGGMTIAEEAVREAQEEVGLTIYPEDLRVVYIAHQKGGNEREYINFYLRVEKWSGEPQNLEPEFCSELGWFPIDNLPKDTQPDVLFALDNYRKGLFFSEFDWDKL